MESRAAVKRVLSEMGEGPTGTPPASTAMCHQEPVTSCTGPGQGAAPQRGDTRVMADNTLPPAGSVALLQGQSSF